MNGIEDSSCKGYRIFPWARGLGVQEGNYENWEMGEGEHVLVLG